MDKNNTILRFLGEKMMDTRYEKYGDLINGLPFVLYTDLKRTSFHCSKESNWHENLEIQFCTDGQGTVLLNGEKYRFKKNDIIVVNSNVVHYTGSESSITYDCMIISLDFCKKMGLSEEYFSPIIQNATMKAHFEKLVGLYLDPTVPYRIAKLNQILLSLLIALAEQYSTPKRTVSKDKRLETVKATILYLRKNYNRKMTLDEISKGVFYDKYALCREFKKTTGQTIFQNLNNYRCIKAIECLNAGYTVAQTASLCGFENLSFFTKTFKKYIGRLPSNYK